VISGIAAPTGEPGGAVLVRLAASARRLAVLDEQRGAEVEQRDSLICEARDTGEHWSAIGTAARLSMSRCVAVVSGGLGVLGHGRGVTPGLNKRGGRGALFPRAGGPPGRRWRGLIVEQFPRV
jgi:hypothetical protein